MLHRSIVATAEQPSTVSFETAHGTLTKVEREIVQLSLGDDQASIHPVGTVRTALRKVVGIRPNSGLADPRLEALRRYAVQFRVSGGVVDAARAAECAEFGYTQRALRQTDDLVRRRIRQRSTLTAPSVAGLVLLGIIMISTGFIWLRNILGDDYVSVIVLGLASVLLMPLVFRRRS